jgi:lactoylglutathione lyase
LNCFLDTRSVVVAPSVGTVNFYAAFEQPTYSLGEVNGQGGWSCSSPSTCIETEYKFVIDGAASLRMTDRISAAPPRRAQLQLPIRWKGVSAMLRKVEHVGIQVRNLDRSIKFYTEVLGLPLRQRVRLNETTELAFLPLGESEIELICKSTEYTFAKEGIVHHLTFRVDDVAGMLDHLRKHGVELIHEQPLVLEKLGVRIAFFWGPDGEKLELLAPSASV